MINESVRKYIESNILPLYSKNDVGHGIEHIEYVIDRSMKFADTLDDINYDMVYVIAAYHDVGHSIDAKNHEKISSEMLLKDRNLLNYFSSEEIKLMSEAVYDHRASSDFEPRNIYGKIVSSADRNTSVDSILKRTYFYRLKHSPNSSLEEIIEESRKHIIDKFGKLGYASEKMYFEDLDYNKFLEKINNLVSDEVLFKEKYLKVNNLVNL